MGSCPRTPLLAFGVAATTRDSSPEGFVAWKSVKEGFTRVSGGHRIRMTDYTQDPPNDEQEQAEGDPDTVDEALERSQQGKGYGEDEGEREEALPE